MHPANLKSQDMHQGLALHHSSTRHDGHFTLKGSTVTFFKSTLFSRGKTVMTKKRKMKRKRSTTRRSWPRKKMSKAEMRKEEERRKELALK